MIFYSQSDGRWKNQLLGYNTQDKFNLGNYGCLVTAWGNMLWKITGDAGYTPPMINQWLKDRRGFLSGGGTMVWSAPLGLGHVESRGIVGSVQEVNQWLKDGPNYAIIEVRTRFGGQHFVAGIAEGTIIDSADGVVKGIGTYTFVSAHIYRAVGAISNPAPASVPPASNNGEPIMTPDQEANAYHIILGREPDIALPSNRTGYQFITDAAAEMAAHRAAEAAAVANLNQTNADLASQVASLTTELAAAKAATPAPTPSPVPEVPATPAPAANPLIAALEASEVEHVITRVAQANGFMHDCAESGLPDLEVKVGMVFHQYSTFMANGYPQVRTQKSKTNGQWYGTDESLFTPVNAPSPDLSRADTINLGASKLFGAIGKLVYNLTHKHK